MVIEKAREVKQMLHLSLNDNNRILLMMIHKWLSKATKAENHEAKFKIKGPANEHGYAGEMTHESNRFNEGYS